jgi:RNA polymerase sigma-70 factor (ECF subfamily)
MTQAVKGLSAKSRPPLSLINGHRFGEDEAQWSQWMASAQQGDQIQYQALLQSLGKAIELYLRAHFGNIDFLEDCVQECLLAVHLGRHTYNSERPFRPWLFAVVRNKAVDLLRKRRPDQTHGEEGGEWNHPASESRAEAFVQREDLFKHLSPPYREAIILTKVLGLTAKEAARHCNVTLPAMKVRVFRAIASLRQQLQIDE